MTKNKYSKNPHSSLARIAHRPTLKKGYGKITTFLTSSKDSKLFNSALLLLIAAFYIFRAHTYILRPQLYAEDGAVWLAGAYNEGIHSVFQSYNGLSHLFDRLFGLTSVHLVPFQYEPLLYVVSALLIFMLLCYYLLSKRSEILTTNYQKLFFALSICLLGNAEEFYFSFSNSVFLFGIIGLLLLVINKSRHKSVNILEKTLFFILCFTNVFSWIYILILAFEFVWQRRRRYYYSACAAVGSITQLLIHLHQPAGQRPDIPIRYLASKATLFEFYNQIITPSLRFGRQDISPVVRTKTDLVFVCLALLLSGIIVALVFLKANYSTKCLFFFCLIITLISLKSPINGLSAPAAIVIAMATYHWGNRYFIFGILGMFIVWAKFSQRLFKKQYLPTFLLVFFTFGLLSSITLGSFYIQKDFIDLRGQYTKGISQLKRSKHQLVVIPINPTGWYITLEPK
jgi:hypothetical protein